MMIFNSLQFWRAMTNGQHIYIIEHIIAQFMILRVTRLRITARRGLISASHHSMCISR